MERLEIETVVVHMRENLVEIVKCMVDGNHFQDNMKLVQESRSVGVAIADIHSVVYIEDHHRWDIHVGISPNLVELHT